MNTAPFTPALAGSATQAPAVSDPGRRRRGRPHGSLTRVRHPPKSQEKKDKEKRKRQEKKLATSQNLARDPRPTINLGSGHQTANYPQPTVNPGVGQQASTNPQRIFHPGSEQQAPTYPQPVVISRLGQLPTSLEASAVISDEPDAFANLPSAFANGQLEAPSLGSSTPNFQAPMDHIMGSGEQSEPEFTSQRGSPIPDFIDSFGLSWLYWPIVNPEANRPNPSAGIVPTSYKSSSPFAGLSVAQIAQIAHSRRMAEAPDSSELSTEYRDGTIDPRLLNQILPSGLASYS